MMKIESTIDLGNSAKPFNFKRIDGAPFPNGPSPCCKTLHLYTYLCLVVKTLR
jgi:hypothetical protein